LETMCDFVCEKSVLDPVNRQRIKSISGLERATRIELAFCDVPRDQIRS